MAAEKGNKHAEGYGRPPIYEENEENIEIVSNLVYDYFEWIKGDFEERERIIFVKNNESGEVEERKEMYQHCLRNPEPPTVTGLTIHLGFSHKSTLYDYSEKLSFSDSIKRGLTMIEKYHEIKTSFGDKCTGNIFVLKNFGWKDKTEVEQTITNTTPLSEQELKQYTEGLEDEY